jgi:hypothetical protein
MIIGGGKTDVKYLTLPQWVHSLQAVLIVYAGACKCKHGLVASLEVLGVIFSVHAPLNAQVEILSACNR